MNRNRQDAIVKLGQRMASEPDAQAKLRNYITCALATLLHDDLTVTDGWENLVYDPECSLALANALAAKV